MLLLPVWSTFWGYSLKLLLMKDTEVNVKAESTDSNCEIDKFSELFALLMKIDQKQKEKE